MASLFRLFCFPVVLATIGCGFDTLASAQTTKYVSVTTDSLKILARNLRQNLQDGSALLADLRVTQLRLALLGVLTAEASVDISVLEQRPELEKPEPQLTAGLVPVADKLIQALDETNFGLARSYTEQLSVQIHKQHELSLDHPVDTGDADADRYFGLTHQLQESIRKGDIAKAAVLAVEVQSAEDGIITQKKRPLMKSMNIYNVNDALGRAAFLRRDYLDASDYLLKASDTPGKDAVLRSFGPDLWLAQALLSAGYNDVVLTFLRRCKAFWSNPQLDEWISVLQRGGHPDFSHSIYSDEPIVTK